MGHHKIMSCRLWWTVEHLIKNSTGCELMVFGKFTCADELLRCGVAAEQMERRIRSAKRLAIRECFGKFPCLEMFNTFNKCFDKTLDSFKNRPRSMTGINYSNDTLAVIVDDYREELGDCFRRENTNSDALFHSYSFASAIYLSEFADRLWGLNDYDEVKSDLNFDSVCSDVKLLHDLYGSRQRQDGKRSPSLPKIKSCVYSADSLQCYQQSLANNPHLKELVFNRDEAVLSCAQRIRGEKACRNDVSKSSNIRSCICRARKTLEERFFSTISKCMGLPDSFVDEALGLRTSSPAGQSKKRHFDEFPMPPSRLTNTRFKQSVPNQREYDIPMLSDLIMPGFTVNGKCYCSSPMSSKKSSLIPPFSTSTDDPFVISSRSYSNSNDLVSSSTGDNNNNANIASQLDKLVNAIRQQQQYATLSAAATPSLPATAQQQLWYYYQQQLQQQQQQRPRVVPPRFRVPAALSAEAGIANGFERFFNGLPPPIR